MPEVFPHPIGIELTGVPKVPMDHWVPGYTNTTLEIKRRRKMYKSISSACNPYHVQIDQHCLEVPSPKLHTLGEAHRFFTKVRGAMQKHGIRPTHPDVVDGGGHIHVGIKDIQLKYYIAKSILRQPFLPWVFSEPDESGSCDNTSNDGDLIYFMKDYSARVTEHDTVEFRFFGAPLDWEEQKDHIDFVFKYIAYCKRRWKKKIPIGPNVKIRRMKRMSSRTAIKHFRELLDQIGLPYSRYEKYVKRNLLPRWEDGRVRR